MSCPSSVFFPDSGWKTQEGLGAGGGRQPDHLRPQGRFVNLIAECGHIASALMLEPTLVVGKRVDPGVRRVVIVSVPNTIVFVAYNDGRSRRDARRAFSGILISRR